MSKSKGTPTSPVNEGLLNRKCFWTLSANIHEEKKKEAGYIKFKAFESCILTKKQNMEDTNECALA